ncbi:MAG: SDR family NAD(P)-dependent oxidoreductase, partial [Gemmataceae bacterium]
ALARRGGPSFLRPVDRHTELTMDAFANRVVLVTGAASGIGKQLTEMLLERGALVAAVDRNQELLDKLAQEHAVPALATAQADVTDRETLHAAATQLQQRLGPVDLLIASAGIGLETSGLFFRAADFEDIIRVNLIGVANSIEAVLGGMIKRRSGHLVALSSIASFRGLPRMAGYCASKSGVNALMDALRVELKPCGIHTTTICPGWIRTPMTENLDVPQPHRLEVDDACGRMLEAIRRKKPFCAFPGPSVRRLRFLSLLPSSWSDSLLFRVLRSLGAKKPGI